MGEFPPRLLSEGEQVFVHTRTHWKALIGPALLTVVLLVCTTLLVQWLTDGWGAVRWLIILAAVVVWIMLGLWPALAWFNSTDTVTDRRLVTRSGVLSRHSRDIPLSKINDVSARTGPLDRIFRCGTIVVESAGERGQILLRDVPDAERVQVVISDLVLDVSRGQEPEPPPRR